MSIVQETDGYLMGKDEERGHVAVKKTEGVVAVIKDEHESRRSRRIT